MTALAVRAGLCTVKFLSAILLAIIKSIKFIFSEIREILGFAVRTVRWLFRELTEPYRNRVRISNELSRQVKVARKEGGYKYVQAVTRLIGSFFFGEDGVFYTAFNWILPIVLIAFLAGVIKYGSGLEYGIAVEYNGKDMGIISAETDFSKAKKDVQQRISYVEGDEAVDLSAKFSLRIISDGEKMMSSGQLADKMLEASDNELGKAYGIYIDGEFIGAVEDGKAVQTALDDRLLNYKAEGIVRDISYVNKIEFTEGIYLQSSIRSEKETIDLLTSSKERKHVHFVEEGETVVDILQKYGMDLDEFNQMNPLAENGIQEGRLLRVVERENYLPIQYVREMETLSFLDYETLEVETSSLNVGTRATLVKGERGEKKSNIEVTYIDGIESSRKVLDSVVTKKPVVETIGVGTYSAMPDYPQTAYFGSPFTGTGEMGWPVDGGWVSDSFISDRNHKGMDIAAPENTEIYAAQEGTVVAAGWNSGGYGNVVMIEHADGYATVYAHMISTYAVEGQYVSKGQLIGFVGTTGDSTGNHCHFEVRYQGICLDPADFINTVNAKKPEEEE
ncbi:MAG: peptidoglycan DD-metalloendopeptidase family protein [Ruminococcus flavefaciens]|nr:peptidoglycan DD-metalloendopeptidase family protein [Ruminococcus flavefaciens]MCM1228781.1 peptidoglycan DD-metalloendopeptidase family protein [Ruminococcus flavefaciens]